MNTASLELRHYPESRFGGYTDVDGTIVFYTRIAALLEPEWTVLDVGCGPGVYAIDPVPYRRQLRTLRGRVRRVIGLDPDPAAALNPFLDEFRQITGPLWPVEPSTVDLLIADQVLEHVDDPAGFFAECARAVRVGGLLCLRTSNLRSYVGLAARLVPNRYHRAVLRNVQNERASGDVYPTRFRCNTVGRVRQALRGAGFDAQVYGFDSEPHYLSFSRLAYWMGVLHQRLAPAVLGPSIFAFAQRTAAPSPVGSLPR